MASNYDYINYKDFEIKNLSLHDCKENKSFGFKAFKIEYAYPDGGTRSLRLRSPVLFSYGIKKNTTMSDDYYMQIKSFYDDIEMGEKEMEFRITLDNISKFLREEIEKRELADKSFAIKRENLGKMDIVTDSGSLFSKLRERKIYKNNKVTGSEITSVFYEKKDWELSKIDPSFIENRPCKVIVYIDIADIFVKNSQNILKIRTYISDVIVIKTDVPTPNNWVKTSNISLGSDDEDDEKNK